MAAGKLAGCATCAFMHSVFAPSGCIMGQCIHLSWEGLAAWANSCKGAEPALGCMRTAVLSAHVIPASSGDCWLGE